MVSADFDSLAELIRTRDTKAGPRIEVHAWLTMFPIATTIEPADRRHVFHAHPEWLSEAYTGAEFESRTLWLQSRARLPLAVPDPFVEKKCRDGTVEMVNNAHADSSANRNIQIPLLLG
jgi:hypothetical protein